MIHDRDRSHIGLYDLFGYLLPGGFVVVAAGLAAWFMYSDSVVALLEKFESMEPTQALLVTALLASASYVAGHLLATIGGLIYDRIFIRKIFKYPSRNLLFSDGIAKKDKVESDFYRSLMTLLYIWVVGEILDQYFEKMISSDHGLVRAVIIQLGDFSRWIIPPLVTLRWIERYMSRSATNHKLYRWTSDFLRYAFFILAIPFRLLEGFIRRFMELEKPFPHEVGNMVRKKFQKDFQVSINRSSEPEVFWLIYWKVIMSYPEAKSRILKYASIYSMTRNSAVSFFVSGMIFGSIGFGRANEEIYFNTTVFCFVTSFVLSVRFYYIYLNYFNKSIYRAYLAGDI